MINNDISFNFKDNEHKCNFHYCDPLVFRKTLLAVATAAHMP